MKLLPVLPEHVQDLSDETLAHMVVLMHKLDQLLSPQGAADFITHLSHEARIHADDMMEDIAATDTIYLEWVRAARGAKKPPHGSIRR